VLVAEVYAVAALLGATVTVAGARLGLPRWLATLLGFAECFGLRELGVWGDWDLPRA
jgi:uncharacterized membrane protein YeiH